MTLLPAMKGVLLFLVMCAPLACGQSAFAQPAGDLADSKTAAAPPAEDLRLLLDLLSRPDIQAWLKAQADHVTHGHTCPRNLRPTPWCLCIEHAHSLYIGD